MRNGAEFRILLMAAVVLVGPTTSAAFAEDDDGPGRGVARISLLNGDVSVRRGDSGDWVAAAVNAPLVVQDTIATGQGSRAEVQFDYANMLRLGSNAEVRISELEYRRYQVQVARGTIEFSVLRNSDADVDVSTPAVSVRPSKRGRYRVTVLDDGEVEVAVRSGEVEVYTPRGVERLTSGNALRARNAAGGPEFQTIAAAGRDEFDRWVEDRDRKLERTASYRYVNSSIYGADDLDGYGRWIYDPAYGWVWAPRAAPGWAPYRYGRWVWADWYGWTWVSHDPWGWAPYHWGRWYHHHNYGWCWYPGPFRTVHYWRPALVAFFGFGVGRVHVGFGFGNVGWVPLAPHEPYYPWYGRQYYGGYRGGYVDRSVHVTNVNIVNVYRNARVRDGVSGVDAGGFGRGNRNIVRVSDGEIRQAGLVRGQLPVAPDSGSLRYADREVRNMPRNDVRDVQFYSRRQPTAVDRVPFAQQQRAFQAAPAVTAQPAAGTRSAEHVAPAAGRRGDVRGASDGWRRAGEQPAQGGPPIAAKPAAAAPATGEPVRRGGASEGDRGWRRFGERPGAQQPAVQQPATRTMETPPAAAPAAERPSTPVRRNEPGERDRNWRRFGERQQAPAAAGPRNTERAAPATEAAQPAAAPKAAEPVRRSEPADRGRSWQRFGEPAVQPNSFAAPRATETPRAAERTWQQFGAPSAAPQRESTGGTVRRSEAVRESAPRFQRSEQRSQQPSFSRPESIRIAPPVVRERSMPRAESAPRVERSAPRMESAPRVERQSGGGGGGQSRGGGGGESRSVSRSGGGRGSHR